MRIAFARRPFYDKTTGALYFERPFASPAIEFAVLDGRPHITFHDFAMAPDRGANPDIALQAPTGQPTARGSFSTPAPLLY
jgi:hypothetical protein